MPRYGRIDDDYVARFRAVSDDADGPVYMLNLSKYRPDEEIRTCGDDEAVGRDDDVYYAPIPLLAAAGAKLCFVADVLASSDGWDRVAVVSYPSRLSFRTMAASQEFQDWHVHKEAGLERTTVMCTLPAQDIPAEASSRRILLEIWKGSVPAPVADGKAAEFEVEGTIIGDGRRWSGARYTEIEAGVPLPLLEVSADYQALLLTPTIEHWASAV